MSFLRKCIVFILDRFTLMADYRPMTTVPLGLVFVAKCGHAGAEFASRAYACVAALIIVVRRTEKNCSSPKALRAVLETRIPMKTKCQAVLSLLLLSSVVSVGQTLSTGTANIGQGMTPF